MKFKKKKKNQMGYFYSMSPGNPKYNAEIFNHLMGSGDMPEAPSGGGGEACGESLNEAQKKNTYEIVYLNRYDEKGYAYIDAYSEKQAAIILKKQRKGIYRILSIDCIEDHSKDDGEQLEMKFKKINESGTVSRRKEDFINFWNSKFSGNKFEINSSEIQQHHVDKDINNNPKDFSNCAYIYSKNPEHLRKAHNYIHAKNLVNNYNLNDVYILSPEGRVIKATREILDAYASKLPNGFETSDTIAEDK